MHPPHCMDCKFCAGKHLARDLHSRCRRAIFEPAVNCSAWSFPQTLIRDISDSIDQYFMIYMERERYSRGRGAHQDLLLHSSRLGFFFTRSAENSPFISTDGLLRWQSWLLVLGWSGFSGFREPRFSCGSFSALFLLLCTTAWSVIDRFTVCFNGGQPMSPVGSSRDRNAGVRNGLFFYFAR